MKAPIAGLLILLIFNSPPAIAQSIALISDINGRYGSTNYHERVSTAIDTIVASRPQLVISAGDLVAGQKKALSELQLELMWQGFEDTVRQPLADAGIEFISTPGNHDGSALPGFEQEQQQYHTHWAEKHPDLKMTADSDWPRRYAVWQDKLLIIAIDGTLPGKLQAADRAFLESTLDRDRAAAERVIVLSHLPMWPFARGREKEILRDPQLQKLLARYQVNFFVSGHHHVFYAGTDAAGVVHIAVGALGGNARKFVGEAASQPFSYVSLELCEEGFKLAARKAPGFTDDVTLSGLPASIEGPMGQLTRLDLSMKSGLMENSCRR